MMNCTTIQTVWWEIADEWIIMLPKLQKMCKSSIPKFLKLILRNKCSSSNRTVLSSSSIFRRNWNKKNRAMTMPTSICIALMTREEASFSCGKAQLGGWDECDSSGHGMRRLHVWNPVQATTTSLPFGQQPHLPTFWATTTSLPFGQQPPP